MKIAFFDSGIGGLSVLAEALRRFSRAEFLYFADEDHVFYCMNSRADIVCLSLVALGFLVAHVEEAKPRCGRVFGLARRGRGRSRVQHRHERGHLGASRRI